MAVSVAVVCCGWESAAETQIPCNKQRQRSERKKGEAEEKETKREELSGPIGWAGYRTQWVRSSRRVRGRAASRR